MFVSQLHAQERLDICKKCNELKMPLYQCEKCGCFMRLKCKIKKSKCPLDKW